MSTLNKRFTMLIGAPMRTQIGVSFNNILRCDSYGVPLLMMCENGLGSVVENDYLCHYAEEVIRKTLDFSGPNSMNEIIMYVGDFLYSEELSISSSNTQILDKIEPISSPVDMMDKTLRDLNTDKTVVDIFKEHYIKHVYVRRNFTVPMYGRRDIICIHFDSDITKLESLDENSPKRLTYLNLLVSFFNVVKNMIVQ